MKETGGIVEPEMILGWQRCLYTRKRDYGALNWSGTSALRREPAD